jgi:phage terminase large subunit-like protein
LKECDLTLDFNEILELYELLMTGFSSMTSTDEKIKAETDRLVEQYRLNLDFQQAIQNSLDGTLERARGNTIHSQSAATSLGNQELDDVLVETRSSSCCGTHNDSDVQPIRARGGEGSSVDSVF